MDIAKRQDFGKIFNADGDHGKTFNSIFSMPNKKDRKFSGATTKRGYGPVFDPMMRNTMSSTVGGAGEASMPAGDAGALGESNNEKFIGLLEALRTDENSDQIDMIKEGFELTHK